jgi:4-hydroxy-4-methyl-2-oxoglutarate aldolase
MTMASEPLESPTIAGRFKALYVAAVCDVLDEYELRHQYVHHVIRPLDVRHKIAGPAFTIVGGPNATRDMTKRMGPRVIDQFTPGVVAMYDTQGDESTGVWGELWSAGAIRRGCVGAVVDGGIRDTGFIRANGFPIFYRFTRPGDAVGRFNIIDYDCPVTIGGVRVRPGDYVFGDEDGVAIIPREITLDVLEKAERVRVKEERIRDALETGRPLADLYVEFGKF